MAEIEVEDYKFPDEIEAEPKAEVKKETKAD